MQVRLLHITWLMSILLLAPLAAAAQDVSARDRKWVLLGSSAESRVYLDSSRVEIADGQPVVWLRFDYAEPEIHPSDPETLYWGVETQHRLGCAAGRTDDLAIVLLNREGAQTGSTMEGSRWKTFADHPWAKRSSPSRARGSIVTGPPPDDGARGGRRKPAATART